MDKELISQYEYRTATPECHPGATSFNVFVDIQDDITAVLPYLNAVLEGPTDYRHENAILLWEGNGKRHAFRPHEIAISSFQSNEDGTGYAQKVVERINDIWRRRERITPNEKGIGPLPNALDLYKLLPRTNCRKCGFPTCMAYAVELRTDASKLDLCPELSEDDFRKALP